MKKSFETHNETTIDVNGTSLQGQINTTYKKLVDTFGEPTESDGYKVDAEWEIKFPDGVATIYNWKNGENYLGKHGIPVDEITDWHIGGFDTTIVDSVKSILK